MILIMWSGGLDSTAALYHYLTRSTEEIMTHHIFLYDRKEPRLYQESIAVDRIRDYLKKNYRSFKYTTSQYFNPLGGKDIVLALFTAGQIINNIKEINKVVTGRCKEDDLNRPGTDHDKIFYASINELSNHVIIERPMRSMTKNEIKKIMPKELVDLTWSCRSPKFVKGKPIPCGQCHACKERGDK